MPDIGVSPSSPPTQSYHLGVDPAEVAATFVVLGYGPDPDSMEEALTLEDADQWILAELSEKHSWDEHDVVEIVPRSTAVSRGKRVFGEKRVFKKKFLPPDATHPEGRLDKHKIRLTIQAYTRMLTEGIDYADKHAGTVRWSAVLPLPQNSITISPSWIFLPSSSMVSVKRKCTWKFLKVGARMERMPILDSYSA